MNIEQLEELIGPIELFEINESEYINNNKNERWDNESEYIIKKYLELKGFQVKKKDYKWFDYDYDINNGSDFIRLEIKQTRKKLDLNKPIPIKFFDKFSKFNRLKCQGTAWDLSSQINNPNGQQFTVFLSIRNVNSKIIVSLLGILDNESIISRTIIDNKLSQFGTEPLGLLYLP